MKKIYFVFSILLLAFFVNAQEVVFNSIVIPFQCYNPHYVHQSSGEISINGKVGFYVKVKPIQMNSGNLQIFNYFYNVKSGLNYVLTSGNETLYYITSNTAKIDVHFEVLQTNLIPGNAISLLFPYNMGKYYGDPQYGTGETNVSSSISVSNTPISGNPTVCSTSTGYTLTGIPSGSSVQWSVGSNLQIIGSNSANPVQVSAINANQSGSTFIIPIVNIGCGIYKLPSKNVWVGKPDFALQSDASVYSTNMYGIANLDYLQGSVSSVNWSKNGAISSITGGPVIAKFRTGKTPGIGEIYALATNACGSTENRLLITVEGTYYLTYPNPTSDILTIELVPDANTSQSTGIKQQNTEMEIKIFDKSNILLRYDKTKGNICSINLQGLKADVYILQILRDGEIYSKQIIKTE